MGAGLLLGAAAALAIALSSKSKKSKKTNDEWDEPIPLEPSLPEPSPTKPPKNKPFVGRYPASVQVIAANNLGFNAAGWIKNMTVAVSRGDVRAMQKLATGLNKDNIRVIHNEFLIITKGHKTIYSFLMKNDKIPFLAKKVVGEFLAYGGVASKVIRDRSKI